MVDVSEKIVTSRTAIVTGKVYMQPETLKRIQEGKIAKGDVLAVAQVAGIMGAKRTPDIIPMCHPLLLTGVDISFTEHPVPDENDLCSVGITATVKAGGRTGVEMEALTAASIAALTIYDMCKAIDKGMILSELCLEKKKGGKIGRYFKGKAGSKGE